MAFSNEMLKKALSIVLERKKANERNFEQQKASLFYREAE